MTMTRAASSTPQFTYHQWPDGTAPVLQFKARPPSTTPLARQLSPHYDMPSPGLPTSTVASLKHHAGMAPRPFVWDSVNQDYFCYDPETTCYVYAKLGRVHYDSVMKEHYRPDAPQPLVYATTFPEYRVYQSGEIFFWDPRRQEWYQYDMHHRRVLWRDQRWWPFPRKFEPPCLSCPPQCERTLMPPNTAGRSKSPVCHTLPADAHNDCAKSEEPRIVEVSPCDASAVETDLCGRSLPDVLEKHEVKAERRRPKKEVVEKEVWVVSDDDDVVYEVPLRDRGHKKHRARRGGMYDLQDLVDKSM